MFVEPPDGTLKVAPARIEYGPPTVAVPLETVAPPLLKTVNTACEVVPVAIVPKLNPTGLTAIWPGVTPAPAKAFVEFPPSLVNTAFALNGPATPGVKLTCTCTVWPGATVYGLPPLMPYGAGAAAVPCR